MAKHVMFDVDGTLVQSYEFDEAIFIASVFDVTGITINSDWASYPHVTDWGLLRTFCENQATVDQFEEWYPQIKSLFVGRIKEHLKNNPVAEVNGARAFYERLINDDHFSVSIATGGWGETAQLKLASAGFELGNTVLKSSNDHYQREKIMLAAANSTQVTYFGDGEWDKTACKKLGYNFIAVGPRVSHHQHLNDFKNSTLAERLIT